MNKQKQKLPEVIRIEPHHKGFSVEDILENENEKLPQTIQFYDPDNFVAGKDYSDFPYVRNIPDNIDALLPNAQYGQTYLKSPYSDKYYLISDFEKKVMDEKMNYLYSILQDVGAVSITHKIQKKDVEERRIEAVLKGQAPAKSVEAEAELKIKKEHIKQYHFKKEIKIQNIAPSIEGYERALRCAEEHNLINDSHIEEVLTMSSPEKGRPLDSYSLYTSLTDELNKTLDIAAKLNYLPTLKLDVAFHIETRYFSTVEVEFAVEFFKNYK